MGENPLRVGIVGSRKYENRKKIKDFIFKLKNELRKTSITLIKNKKDPVYKKKFKLDLSGFKKLIFDILFFLYCYSFIIPIH